MDPTLNDDSDAQLGDVLVGAAAIARFITALGWPVQDDEVYYLKRSGWPIGSAVPNSGKLPGSKRRGGGKLVGSKRRIARYVDKLARGPAAA